MPQTVAKFQQTALFRDQKRHVNVGNFKADIQHKLIVTKITSSLVADRFDCTFICVSESTCESFNIAANPDSDGLYVCELLDTDKYRATENDLQVNVAFHHFSPLVSCNSFFNHLSQRLNALLYRYTFNFNPFCTVAVPRYFNTERRAETSKSCCTCHL